MAAKTSAVTMRKVLKTLSAVRQTLSPEEQNVLDSLLDARVLRFDDVEGHAMRERPTATKPTAMKTQARQVANEPDDVEAHAMRADKPTTMKPTAMKTQARQVASEPDEVEAHAMREKPTATKPTAMKTQARNVAAKILVFDAESGEYRQEDERYLR